MTPIDPVLGVLQPLWLASLVPEALRFQRALRDPARTQRRLLLRRLADNTRCAYGREHGFATIRSVADFQRRVPIARYDALGPWLARVAAGEAQVLTEAPVRLMERSGGSTASATKLIPYTAELLLDFARATNPWLADLYRRFPRMIGRPAYWSLSPVVQGERHTAGGVPIGIDDDTAYFGPLRRFVIARSLAVPGSVARVADFTRWRHETLVHLVSCESLGFISVWSPTFLVVLLQALAAQPDRVLATLSPRRAKGVAKALAARSGRDLWPDLQAISCWTEGPSAAFVPALEAWFPGLPIAGKGLLATEGVVSIPLAGRDPTLALTSHFLELIDLDHPERTPLLAHELRPGASYSPLLTTGGGLYRYHLEDIVRCTGPMQIRFEGKLDQVADLTGEKLHAGQVQAGLDALQRALGVTWDHAFVAPVVPEVGVPYYCLYLDDCDSRIEAIATTLEAHFRQSHAYRYSRDLGQLGPVRVQQVTHLRERQLDILVARGQRLGDIKPSVLDRRPIWAATFGPRPSS